MSIMSTATRAHRVLRRRVSIIRQSLGIGGREASREWYFARLGIRLGVGATLIGAWIHGIYWAGGLPGAHAWIMQINNPNSSAMPPMGILLIDFAPLIIATLACVSLVGFAVARYGGAWLIEKWRSLPSYGERRGLVERHHAIAVQRRIAELEREYDNLGRRIAALRNSRPSDVLSSEIDMSLFAQRHRSASIDD